MKIGSRLYHKPTKSFGTCKGKLNALGRFRCELDDGSIQLVLLSDCQVGKSGDPKSTYKRPHVRTKSYSLAQCAWATNLHPDEICHRAAMVGLELNEAISALME